MESITLSRTLSAPPDAVRELIDDLEPFMRAAGFSTVEVSEASTDASGSRTESGDEGDRMTIGKGFAMASIELDLDLVDDPETVLAYEQHEGIFEEMWTGYYLEETDEGSELTVTTEFALDVAGVGAILDATVIKRQRTKELTGQFDYLESELDG
ncbi:SRPBCC family protein [Halorientalis salina]|uniref:SRPBCC family protein n=1 Tax=Halorientalis salina TaxID=2932266 RepID=UPI0010AC7874|nr:SRPBCC family protein [Halorientalis salina]